MWALFATLGAVGLLASFLSGLLGVGGSAFIIPLLLYVPRVLGTGALTMKEAAGLSIALILVGSLSGALAHRASSHQAPQVGKLLAPVTAGGALAGAVLTPWVPSAVMAGIFATLALAAGLLMFRPSPPGGDEPPPGVPVTFSRPLGVTLALAVGFLSGLVGAGGAFVLVPLMIYVLKIPTRLAMASSLQVVFFSAIAGFTGKALAGQVPWFLALGLVIGAIPGARLGAYLSRRIPAVRLRYGLAALTTGLALRLWLDVFQL